ncbi:inositol monophosphatase family protein [Patescibacteria group bacterium]
MTKQLRTAFAAADAANKIALKYWRSNYQVKTKANYRDLVTTADLEINEALCKIIARAFPNHGIISEEAPATGTGQEYVWVIDPIDGTSNFTMGLPTFGVSIALLKNGQPHLGVVDFPALNERYWAEAGKGAFMKRGNARPIRCQVSNTNTLKQSNSSIGFCTSTKSRQRYINIIKKIFPKIKANRVHYSAVFDFCNVARGGMDFYLNYGIHLWDFAACWCIVQEAGGEMVNLKGDSPDLKDADILATNGQVTKQLLKIL